MSFTKKKISIEEKENLSSNILKLAERGIDINTFTKNNNLEFIQAFALFNRLVREELIFSVYNVETKINIYYKK
jgi:hypothetical protein